MIVKELIKHLKKFDQSAIVVLESDFLPSNIGPNVEGIEFYTINELQIANLESYSSGMYYLTEPFVLLGEDEPTNSETRCLVLK